MTEGVYVYAEKRDWN